MSHIFKGWLICILGSIICLALMAYKSNMQNPDYADSRQYISSAYNLSNYNVYSQNLRTGGDVAPAIGREPGFPYLLSFLFDLNMKEMTAITPDCLATAEGCGLAPYKSAQWLNRILFAFAGISTFWAIFKVYNSIPLASIGGAAIWLNKKLQSNMDQVVSDPLALFLVCLLTLCFIYTYTAKSKKHIYIFSAATGLTLSSLILTKAIFLYFLYAFLGIGILIIAYYAIKRENPKKLIPLFCIIAVCSATGPALWIKRNAEISGQHLLTDSREGIALSARVIFHEMSVAEYFTSFLYWTPSFGDNLARRYLPTSAWERLDTKNPEGFFLAGHHNFGKDVRKITESEGISGQEATVQHTSALKKQIITNPIIHSLTTLPLFYRGIVRDSFFLLSFPGLLFLIFRCMRKRNSLILLALSPAIFNLLFYPLISLNVSRYQITAAPAFAFGLVAFVIAFTEWRKRKKEALLVSSK